MSISGPAGYPDFGRYGQQTATLIRYDSLVPWAGGTTSAPVYVGNLAALSLYWQFGGQFIRANCFAFFYDDQAATKQTGVRAFGSDGQNTCHSIIPVLGNWLTIQLSSTAAIGPTYYNLIIQGFTWRPDAADLVPGYKLQVHQFLPLAAGGGIGLWGVPDVCDTFATAAIESGNGPIELQVQQQDYSGTWYTVIDVFCPAGQRSHSESGWLDCVPTRWAATNFAGAIQTLQASLVFGA